MSNAKKVRAPTHPGEILREEFMRPLGLNQIDTARILMISPATLCRVMSSTGRVSADLALRLARVFNTTPEYWLNLQTARDLHAVQLDPYFQRQLDALKPYPMPEASYRERMDDVVLTRSHENQEPAITGDRPMSDTEVLNLISSKEPK